MKDKYKRNFYSLEEAANLMSSKSVKVTIGDILDWGMSQKIQLYLAPGGVTAEVEIYWDEQLEHPFFHPGDEYWLKLIEPIAVRGYFIANIKANRPAERIVEYKMEEIEAEPENTSTSLIKPNPDRYYCYTLQSPVTYTLDDVLVPAEEIEEFKNSLPSDSNSAKLTPKERNNILALVGGLIKILGYDKTTLGKKQSNERIQTRILDKLQEANYSIDGLKNIRKKTIPEALGAIESRKE